MLDHVEEWILYTSTPEFLKDAEDMYTLSMNALVAFVKRSGAEFILNKNIDFYLGYHGSQSDSKRTVHFASVALRESNTKEILYQEHYTMEVMNNE